jgi:hypothetical protein
LHPHAKLSYDSDDISPLLHDESPTLNLLSYAHVATVKSDSEPVFAASNREDILTLTQSQMLKMPDRDSFIQSQKAEIVGYGHTSYGIST